jgi:hypothetical protein
MKSVRDRNLTQRPRFKRTQHRQGAIKKLLKIVIFALMRIRKLNPYRMVEVRAYGNASIPKGDVGCGVFLDFRSRTSSGVSTR